VCGDEGIPIVVSEPNSPASRALSATADRIVEALGAPAAV
jgi:MinD-like ATPase involved in chromosome partitioning or flagellar assembly